MAHSSHAPHPQIFTPKHPLQTSSPKSPPLHSSIPPRLTLKHRQLAARRRARLAAAAVPAPARPAAGATAAGAAAGCEAGALELPGAEGAQRGEVGSGLRRTLAQDVALDERQHRREVTGSHMEIPGRA